MARWSVDIGQLAQKMKEEPSKVQRKVAFACYQSITELTPVDTGRARANWNISVEPDFSTTDSTKRTLHLSDVPQSNTICISNGLPYIRRLEYGWSRQAPNGMVGITALKLKSFVERSLDD